MAGKIKGLFQRLWAWVKSHPVLSVIILVVLVVGLSFATLELMHLTSEPKFCRMCHPEEGTGALAEYDSWSKNIHASNGVLCLDCHSKQPGAWGYLLAKMGGLRDVYYEIRLSPEEKLAVLQSFEGNVEKSADLVTAKICLHCHSDEINAENRDMHFMSFAGIKMRDLDKAVNPAFREFYGMGDVLVDPVSAGVEPQHAMHIAMDIPCASCHINVSHSGQFRSPLYMETCFECHDTQRADGGNPVSNDDCESCHVNNVALQDGNAAAKFGVVGDEWYMRDLGCDGCHYDAFHKPTRENCADCHDEDYPDLMDFWQEDFDERYNTASNFWKGNIPNRPNMTEARREIFNTYENILSLLEKDGSRGVHNPDYVDMLFDHLDDLQGQFEGSGN